MLFLLPGVSSLYLAYSLISFSYLLKGHLSFIEPFLDLKLSSSPPLSFPAPIFLYSIMPTQYHYIYGNVTVCLLH